MTNFNAKININIAGNMKRSVTVEIIGHESEYGYRGTDRPYGYGDRIKIRNANARYILRHFNTLLEFIRENPTTMYGIPLLLKYVRAFIHDIAIVNFVENGEIDYIEKILEDKYLDEYELYETLKGYGYNPKEAERINFRKTIIDLTMKYEPSKSYRDDIVHNLMTPWKQLREESWDVYRSPVDKKIKK